MQSYAFASKPSKSWQVRPAWSQLRGPRAPVNDYFYSHMMGALLGKGQPHTRETQRVLTAYELCIWLEVLKGSERSEQH